MWKAAAVAARLPGARFPYQEILPIQVAEARYGRCGEGDARAELARSWLEQLYALASGGGAGGAGRPPPTHFTPVGPEHNRGPRGGVCMPGRNRRGRSARYGSTRTTLEVGKCLTRAGRWSGPSARGMGFCRGTALRRRRGSIRVHKALRRLGPVDTLIGISRRQFPRAERVWLSIYQQEPIRLREPSVVSQRNAHAGRVRVARFGRGAGPMGIYNR